MRLSTRSRYGTRMMIDLAKHYRDGPVQMKDISERQNVSLKYLEQLVIPLKKADFIRSVRGPKGGHMLSRSPARIRLGDVVRALESQPDLVNCLEDPALVQRLVRERMPLTVCPLSNVKLCVFPTLAQHNLPALLDAGLCVTINSDDPAYFGGYVNDNFVQTFAALPQLDARHAWQLAANSFEASFASAEEKARWTAALQAAFDAAA